MKLIILFFLLIIMILIHGAIINFKDYFRAKKIGEQRKHDVIFGCFCLFMTAIIVYIIIGMAGGC